MIDQDKMRALANALRRRAQPNVQSNTWVRRDNREAADAIDLLLAEVEAAKEQSRKWQALTEAAQQLVKTAQRRVDKLRTELEAAEADKREIFALLPGTYYMDPPDGGDVPPLEQLRRMAENARRYRWLRTYPNNVNASVYGPTGGLLRRDEYLDVAIDAALAQRQGEGS